MRWVPESSRKEWSQKENPLYRSLHPTYHSF
ncbi:MAG: hypothetical protein E7096_09970 [Bacteroides sp.]|nr:hypothetical protein [Bacteroides sp.]